MSVADIVVREKNAVKNTGMYGGLERCRMVGKTKIINNNQPKGAAGVRMCVS